MKTTNKNNRVRSKKTVGVFTSVLQAVGQYFLEVSRPKKGKKGSKRHPNRGSLTPPGQPRKKRRDAGMPRKQKTTPVPTQMIAQPHPQAEPLTENPLPPKNAEPSPLVVMPEQRQLDFVSPDDTSKGA